jgi:hypothetical protein
MRLGRRSILHGGGEVAKQEVAVEWVLIVSLQWVVGGSATAPTTHTMVQFQTEESCKAAAQENESYDSGR